MALTIPPAIYLPAFGLGFLWLYLAHVRWRLILICYGILIVALWLGQIAPIGAIRTSNSRIHIAVIEEGQLVHSHRLTSFWSDSYAKLLGSYHETSQIKCRYKCQIELINGQIIMVNRTNRKAACPKGKGLILTHRPLACPQFQTIVMGGEPRSAILYYNKLLGYYLKESRPPVIKQPWHP